MNNHKSNGQTGLYKSPSSNFICSKCGLGYPCTLFLCKRNTFPCNSKSGNQKPQLANNISEENEDNNSNSSEISRVENKNSEIIYSTLELQKTNSSQENIVDLISRVLSEDVSTQCISNKELTHVAMQDEDDATKFKVSDDEYVTNIKNALDSKGSGNIPEQEILETVIKDTNDLQLDHLAMTSASNTQVKATNERTFEKPNSIKTFDSLSEETTKFLSELTFSGSESNVFNVDASYGEAPITQDLNSKVVGDSFIESHSSDNCQAESKSSISNTNQCNIDVTKDVTNALDFIEQSSLYDRNLSSAEICNSLNQMFSESASTDLPTNNASTVELTQSEGLESSLVSNNSSLHVNNSGIIVQGEETATADSETYINISDLCSGTSNNVQSILLIQDASGNVETMYLIEDDLNKEGTVSLIQNITNNGESIVLPDGFKIEDILQNQYTVDGENVFVDITSDQVQNLVVMQDASVTSTNETFESETKDKLLDNSLPENRTLTAQSLDGKHFVGIKDVSDGDTHTDIMNSDVNNGKIMLINENEMREATESNLLTPNGEFVNNISIKHVAVEKPTIFSNISGNLDMVKGEENNVILADVNINNANTSKNNVFNIPQQHTDSKTALNSTVFNVNEKLELINSENNNSYEKILPQNYNQVPKSNSKPLYNSHEVNEVSMNGISFDHQTETENSNKVINNNEVLLVEKNYANFPKIIPTQKSKKSSHNKGMKRTAKKSASPCGYESNYHDLTQLSNTSNSLDSLLANKAFYNSPSYSELKNLILKRKDGDITNQNNCKRTKTDELNNALNIEYNNLKPKSRFVALKTFKKPFTAAKKSLAESKESTRNDFKNKALKTFVSKSHLLKTALKSIRKPYSEETSKTLSTDTQILPTSSNEKIASDTTSNLHYNPQLKIYIQPEISEIRLLPNDCLKRVTNLLQNPRTYESLSTLEDNGSEEEETKLSSGHTSPVEEVLPLKPFCTCSAKEVPCICNDYNLQLICEGEDSINETIIPCTRTVSKQYLLTPSSEVRYRAFCDIHLTRLRQHHCCPKCGIFCSQGTFILCSPADLENAEDHLFHCSCFLIPAPGLPPACPHCCKFAEFKSVNLIYMSIADNGNKEVPSDSKNITNELDDCDIFMTINPVEQDVINSSLFLPQKNDVKTMITSLAKDKSLRLRPTGKCLYNPIKTGDVQKVMQLIANGVNPNHKFRMHSNNAPLHVAAYYGWIGILHILLQAGAQIDAVNDDLETPLIVAVERNQLHIVRYLMFAGAQIDVKDCNGMTSFHIASKNGFKEITEFLYSTGLVDVNLQDDGGWTSLVWACEYKHVELVKWLLDVGSDPNVRDNEENTVLHWAAYSGKSEIAELLLEKGCTLSYVNKRGDSALHIAARENNYECVKLLASRGAVLDQKNKENKTPLMCCEDDSLSWNFLCQCISSGTLKIGKMQLEKHVVFRDISRGAEAYPIQAINEVDDEEFIMEFRYVVKNCHRSGVDIVSTVNEMVFCYCKDNCLTRDCNCFLNSKCWYDGNGCLTAEFELLSPPVIFECNKTCHCPKTCINRVVQQGLRCPLQLFRTKFQGWGVRTLQDLQKGAFVCEYVGELITGTEATQRDDDTYFFDLESKDSDYCLDGRYYGNVARFINHSCEPNLMAVKVFVEHQDLNFPRIAFFTLRNIQTFEELCFDYGLDFWIVKSQSILCTCNTQSCKYSKDTIDETLEKFFMDTES